MISLKSSETETMDYKESKTADLENLSKEQLICRVNKLEANVRQLRSIIRKRHLNSTDRTKLDCCDEGDQSPIVKIRKSRSFDFSRYCKRHIALKFLYLGWDYQGFVVQEDTSNTIEDHLFHALVKTRLIEDRSTSNYHRCGRTDKGVSAFSQVISIDVRSKLKSGLGVINSSNPTSDSDYQIVQSAQDGDEHGEVIEEIDYCGILNKVLPNEIRCISWAPVRPTFSARFDCKGRCYYYYFPVSSLNIGKMKEAATHLLGTHDFTNFCKKDTSKKEINNIRRIQKVNIFPFNPNKGQTIDHSPYSIYIVEIAANGFLWHQIRCIMTILFLIGEGKEEPNIVKKLLDVKSVTSKPQYMLASELPLVLFETDWSPDDVGTWNHSRTVISDLIKHLESLWTREAIKCSMIRSMIDNVTKVNPNDDQVNYQHSVLINEGSIKSYKPILSRPRCGGNQS